MEVWGGKTTRMAGSVDVAGVDAVTGSSGVQGSERAFWARITPRGGMPPFELALVS